MGCLKLDLVVLWAGLLVHLTESIDLNLELFEFGIQLEKSSSTNQVAELPCFPPPLPPPMLPWNGVLHAPIGFPAFDHRARQLRFGRCWVMVGVNFGSSN
ncbi:hypothetical protein ACH5RR_001037 [Cinchona calisaya]|uniref:Secreted protein n=1 Tax=Cinchona calisaya TaxID=153742 RepID=A0ABD3B2N9_9GENT